MSIRLLHGDCLIELPKLAAAGERFHAVVCDPPYGLEFMGKEWDGANGFRRSLNEADAGRDSVFGRTSKHGPEYQTGAHWQTGAGFSKPGIGERETPWPAFTGGDDEFGGANPTCAMCGGRARGKKKCACAEPDWRVKGAAPDKMYGRHRQMRTYQDWCEAWARALYECLLPGAYLFAFGGTRTRHRMVCGIEDAGFQIVDEVLWLHGQGFPKNKDVSKAIDKAAGAEREVIEQVRVRGGGTEHINRSNAAVHDYRPDGYQKGENVLDVTAPATPEAEKWAGFGTALKPSHENIIIARKPLDGTIVANVLKHGCGALNIDASRIEGSPEPTRFDPAKHSHEGWRMTATGAETAARAKDGVWGTSNATVDRGRMFNGSPDMGEYRSEKHPLGRWPANIAHDGSEEVLAAFADYGDRSSTRANGNPNDPIHGSNGSGSSYEWGDVGRKSVDHRDTGTAARFFYTAKADKADRADSKHPTVKPVDLIRWLVTLACPPGGHVLDCFAGSGTTGEACMLAGFDCTLIEREAQHARDIEHRIKRWSGLDAPLFAEIAP
jgi:site-specific DNA-methyltransferase (adenine-specific)